MGSHTQLNAAALEELGRPFTLEAVKYKVQRVVGQKGLATFYVDARLVAERLNHVVGPEGWEDEYLPLLPTGLEMATHHFPVQCKLYVLELAKTDVGVYQRNQPDANAWKAAYSDAFKRAAVKFRVGAYLYAIPNAFAPVEMGQDGKAKGFSKEGKAQLEAAYLRWLDNAEFNRFGEALDHGDTVMPEADDEAEAIEFPESRVA